MSITLRRHILIVLLLLTLIVSLVACIPSQTHSLIPHSTSLIPDTTISTSTPTKITATPNITPVCTEVSGSTREITLSTKLLKYDLEAKVYLPPCYRYSKDQQYPVLYMLHGMADTNDQWVRLGITKIADQLISSNLMLPMIIVMPYEISWQLTPEESNYGEAIVDVLIPYIEKHYPVCTERDCRAIGGLSRGGNWAVEIGFANWQKFTAIGAHSTPLFYGEVTRIAQSVQSMPSPKDAPAIYVDAGKKDSNLAQVEEFEKTLNDLGVDHQYHLNGGYHDDAYWSAHTEQYLLWYSSKMKAP